MTGPLSCLLLAALPAAGPAPVPQPPYPGLAAPTQSSSGGSLQRPTADNSSETLWAYEKALAASYGGDRRVPFAVKADHYAWVIGRHQLERFPNHPSGAPVGIVHQKALVPKQPGGAGGYNYGVDTLTWNGALLQAMSYRWAVTRDPAALEMVRTLIGGIELGIRATGRSGLVPRCYTRSEKPVGKLRLRYRPKNGPTIYVHSDAAKGTVNQVAAGLIVAQLLCGDALSPTDRNRAAMMSVYIANHLAQHDYKLTEANGKRTEYGDMTPRIGPQAVPFNAQVSYLAMAGGAAFASRTTTADPNAVKAVRREFEDLRAKHHVYYEVPSSPIRPQRIGASPVVKGMNDRHHILIAGYAALLLEWELARANNVAADGQFLYEMGRTPLYAARGVRGERNALLSFLWAGLLTDGRRAAAMLPDPREREAEFALARAEVADGVEHLRRFPVSRRAINGEKVGEAEDVWIAEQRPFDCYVWKADPDEIFRFNGSPTQSWAAGIDFLHAYWAARYWGLPGVE